MSCLTPLLWAQRGFDKLRYQCPVHRGKVPCKTCNMSPPTDRGSPPIYTGFGHCHFSWEYLIHETNNLTLFTFNVLERSL